MTATRQQNVKTYLVVTALQIVENFCKKYKVALELPTLARITMALHTRTDFEWTPCAEAFRRIIFIPKNERGQFALVFNYDTYDKELSDELNQHLQKHVGDRWDTE